MKYNYGQQNIIRKFINNAYFYKEQFLKILNNKDVESAKQAMSNWIQNAENCGIPHVLKQCKIGIQVLFQQLLPMDLLKDVTTRLKF